MWQLSERGFAVLRFWRGLFVTEHRNCNSKSISTLEAPR
jgi:hypothetical protein